jgi:hypothetical protein
MICFIAFYTVHFVGRNTEFKKLQGMNNVKFVIQKEDSSWYKGILCKPKVFQKQTGHQAVEIKIIQNCNKTNSDLCLRNMGIERSHNSEIISL